MTIRNATDADYAAVLDAATGQPVLIDFWATWCGPCRQISPIVEQIAAENPDYAVIKVDVDQAPQTALAHNIMSVPTLLVLNSDGTPAQQYNGPTPKQTLLTALAGAR